eukprot:m.651673 g.651673  ORF g.651673 m.651673 type:complete len:295 (-) comp22679_c0_seq5:3591-4475(-)
MAHRDRQLQHVQLPGPGEILVKTGKYVINSPRAISFIAIWTFGLFVMLYASAPYQTTEEQRVLFENKLAQSDSVPGYHEAFEKLLIAQEEVYHAKTWFWWMSSSQSERVSKLQAREQSAATAFASLEKEREGLRKDAFGIVGLWSEYGVAEARQLFWDCLEKGKGFAKRSTMWDMFFGVVMGRDEELGSFIIRLVMNFAINVTVGLIGVIFAFIYYLVGLVQAYQAGIFSGLAFFVVALIAGLSVALLYIFVIYGAIVGGGYMIVRSAVNNRIGGAQGQTPMRSLHAERRPHYD